MRLIDCGCSVPGLTELTLAPSSGGIPLTAFGDVRLPQLTRLDLSGNAMGDVSLKCVLAYVRMCSDLALWGGCGLTAWRIYGSTGGWMDRLRDSMQGVSAAAGAAAEQRRPGTQRARVVERSDGAARA